MDIAKAKFFIYYDMDIEKIYTSISIDKILEQSNHKLISVYAVLDTPSGDMLFDTDFSYQGDPIIMGSFLHYEFYKDAYCHKDWIDLDNRK